MLTFLHSRTYPSESMSSIRKATPLLFGAPNMHEVVLIDIRQNFLDLFKSRLLDS